jgi:hypothetical protein
MAISLRMSCAVHIKSLKTISVVKDYFGYRTTLPQFSGLFAKRLPGTISVLQQAKLLETGQVVHLHLKIVWPLWREIRLGLSNPKKPQPTIDEMVFAMRTVYGKHGIGVVVQSIEDLDLPANFWDITVDSSECDDLFDNNRHGVKNNHVVVFFVRLLDPSNNGVHPPGRDGAIVSWIASRWTIAHEVGHALGLDHVDDGLLCQLDHLMTGCGTWKINVAVPRLDNSEVETMKDSDLTIFF